MKWMIVIALSLLLVVMCVVYFRHGMRPYPVPPAKIEIVKKPAVKIHKAGRAPLPKPGPKSPIDISGPLKNRDLVSWVLPDYPDWAQEQGIMGTLRMRIWVNPAGVVKSLMEPEQLSADTRLDEKAVDALRQWKFVEIPNSVGDQWGVVTFRFALLAQDVVSPEASLKGVSLGGSTVSGLWQCAKQWVGNEFRYYCRLVRPPVQ